RQRAHRAGDVVGQADNARGLDTGGGLELVKRHDRTGPDFDDLAADAEILEHRFEEARVLLQGLLVDRGSACRWHFREQLERRQHLIGGFERERRLAQPFHLALARRQIDGRRTARWCFYRILVEG